MIELLWLFTGVIIGGAGVWFIAKYKFASESEDSAALQIEKERVANLQQESNSLKADLEKERQKVLELNNSLSTTEADYRNLQEKLKDQKEELGKLQEKFSIEFKNLANEIFEEKSKKFTDQNKTNLGELLNPLKERITEFEKKVEINSKESLEQSTALREQLKGLRELNQQMSKEAENLTKALKGDSKTQGNWGEFILESVLEKSGLEKGREYFVQESFTNDEGRRLQPDVIVRLPEKKSVIIDSKVSLISYERYVNADDENDRLIALKAHVNSVKAHVVGLSKKEYHKLYDLSGIDYILMFVPIEPAWTLTLQASRELYEMAFDKQIIIVSPTHLMATLKTIASIWKIEYQNQNAMEIADQAGKLYDKFTNFTEDLIKVGRQLNQTQSTYQDAMKKLSEGKDNLIRKTERLRELGANTSKTIDQKLLDRSTE